MSKKKHKKSGKVKPSESAASASLDSRVEAAVTKSLGGMLGGVITALRGGLPGGWSSDHREEAQHNTGWNYIAIHAISCQVASADVQVYRDTANEPGRKMRRKAIREQHGSVSRYRTMHKALYGREDRETDPLPQDHQLVQILSRPNAKQSGGHFNYQRAQQLRLTGCCLVWNCPSQAVGANGERLIYERYVIPTAIATPVAVRTADMPLGGWRISGGASRWINLSDDGFTEYPGWYQLLNKVVDARQVQVIRLPHANWLDDGQSPISAGALWTDLSNEIDTARLHHLKRGATPSIHVDLGPESQLDQDGMDRAAEKYGKKYGGADKTGAVFITQGDVKINPLSDTAKDMCYQEGFADSKAACLSLHQTPPVAVGLQEAGAYAAYYASMMSWRHSAIQPICDMLAESDTITLGPIYGDGLVIEIEAPDVQDKDLLEKQLANDLAARTITVNEWRAIRGRPPIPGPEGDRLVGDAGADSAAVAGTGMEGDASAAGKTVAEEALNGAQIASLMDILSSVTSKLIPPETALATMQAAFPSLDPSVLSGILDPLIGYVSPVLADGSPNPAAAGGDGGSTGGGEFSDTSRLQWKRNISAIRDVLNDVISGKNSDVMAQTLLESLGLSSDRADKLIQDAKDGSIDDPDIAAGTVPAATPAKSHRINGLATKLLGKSTLNTARDAFLEIEDSPAERRRIITSGSKRN